MSDMKHDAIVGQGIPIHKRVEIPPELIPADSMVEIGAKIAAGYYSGTQVTDEQLENIQGRGWNQDNPQWEDLDVSNYRIWREAGLTLRPALNGAPRLRGRCTRLGIGTRRARDLMSEHQLHLLGVDVHGNPAEWIHDLTSFHPQCNRTWRVADVGCFSL